MKDVIDSGSSQAVNNTLFHELSFYHISIRGSEPINQIEYHWSFVFLSSRILQIKLRNLEFFVSEKFIYLFWEAWNALHDMRTQYTVHRLWQIRNAKFVSIAAISRMFRKELSLIFNSVFNAHILIDLSLTSAFDSIVAQFQRINFSL
jgi:hypothetical protein